MELKVLGMGMRLFILQLTERKLRKQLWTIVHGGEQNKQADL